MFNVLISPYEQIWSNFPNRDEVLMRYKYNGGYSCDDPEKIIDVGFNWLRESVVNDLEDRTLVIPKYAAEANPEELLEFYINSYACELNNVNKIEYDKIRNDIRALTPHLIGGESGSLITYFAAPDNIISELTKEDGMEKMMDIALIDGNLIG